MSQSTARRPTVVEPKGDRRRAALLAALDRMLDERALAEIAISEITSRAGVTRSAFYFYFSSKEAAAAELIGDIYTEAIEAAAVWFDADGENPQSALRSGMQASVEMWRRRPGLMVAMLDAVAADAGIRAVFQDWVERYTARAALRIARDRAAGLARVGVEPYDLATVLVGATFRAMERDVRDSHAGREPSPDVDQALYEVWGRSIYREAQE